MNDPASALSSGDAQQRFLRHYLASEREVFRTVAALIPNVEDARDVVQQATLALWERFGDYDPSRPFSPWACTFAQNLAKQWLTRHQRWQAVLNRGLVDELTRRREELLPEMDSRFRHLEECLGKLPEEQRGLIEGYYQRRAPIETLAQEVGRTVDAVYKMLQRLRTALRGCIEKSAQLGGADA
ncbi:MAG: sigma-70 family RNA polymerase sigma factor [Planctomycetia bacterium]|nr:sigma-70 family RNA polymerase sigma factor [Planctomycetia bacterium]